MNRPLASFGSILVLLFSAGPDIEAQATDGQLSKASTGQESYLQMDDGVKIYYREVGKGTQTVIIPAAVWTSPHFDALAERGFRVVYYDPRGRGHSETGDLKNVSLDRATKDLESLRAKLGAEKTALVGFSGYGLEMAWYALLHPERVSRLVQINPVPPRQDPHMKVRGEALPSRLDNNLRDQSEGAERGKARP